MSQTATILVIDDEPQIRKFLRISLASQGYKVIEAGTGNEGLAQAALSKPDLLVLDLGLPDMDGKQLATKVRELRATLPILFASGYAENIDVPAGMQVIGKPFSIDQLRAKVKSML